MILIQVLGLFGLDLLVPLNSKDIKKHGTMQKNTKIPIKDDIKSNSKIKLVINLIYKEGDYLLKEIITKTNYLFFLQH